MQELKFHTKIDEICVLAGLLKLIIKFTILTTKIIAAEGFSSGSESKESACNAGPTLKMKVKSLSRIRLSATQWTVARQAPQSLGILQARILEWVAMPFFQTQGWNAVSHITGRFFEPP